jgi:hypothetical protein
MSDYLWRPFLFSGDISWGPLMTIFPILSCLKNTVVENDIPPEFPKILPTSGACTGADLSQDVTAERIKGL